MDAKLTGITPMSISRAKAGQKYIILNILSSGPTAVTLTLNMKVTRLAGITGITQALQLKLALRRPKMMKIQACVSLILR